ncbi:H-type small acid-soluble spore protein [Alicyclobacillus acidoterrestris]|uniref:H-type small acid-soluble spore protein n=1 Tax=Alicyclobacillus TaxID=29330 RepID=UPI001A8E190D|nr:H-type small acid-soluble spore protein [Alicyclobacillus suci]
MDMQRAKEIFESPDYIDVTYEGTPVRIDRLFESSPYAEVSYENGSVTNVPVSELQEKKSVH